MAYIKIPADYRTRPKVRKYIELSGDRMATLPIVSLLLALEEQAQVGCFVITVSELETLGRWRGRRGQAVAAMVEAGLIKEIPNGFEICDWEAEQGHISKNREKTRKAANALWKGVTVDAPSIASSNAPSIRGR